MIRGGLIIAFRPRLRRVARADRVVTFRRTSQRVISTRRNWGSTSANKLGSSVFSRP